MKYELEKAAQEIISLKDKTLNGIKLSDIIERRVQEFASLGVFGKTKFDFRPFLDIELETGIFGELCFCILTANSSAELGIRIQKEVGDEGFYNLPEEKLAKIFSDMGHRYANIRAKYIILARNFDLKILEGKKNGKFLRNVVMRIKGLGMKESSHFLRNIGFSDVAIVDRHIYRFLVRHNIVPFKKTITPTLYLQCESALEQLSKMTGIPLPALDLYIFYNQSGKVLK